MKKLFFTRKDIIKYARSYLEQFTDMELCDIKCDSVDGIGIYRFYFKTNYNGLENQVMEEISISSFIFFVKSVIASYFDINPNCMFVTLNSNGCSITYNNQKVFPRVRKL